ncbi:hypothetical protein NQ317_007452 [Molorchus minor]|uniref:Protein grindelwald n=1 Tax=Molorchus minor TaxID=1323400 RepID=A0ABQ9JEL6_9CUCU|nr:hypothetical protein NQ317_007452 [Molorchus minor]
MMVTISFQKIISFLLENPSSWTPYAARERRLCSPSYGAPLRIPERLQHLHQATPTSMPTYHTTHNQLSTFALVFGALLSSVLCELTIEGVKCGQRTCKLTEYCSEFDRTCQSCSGICNATVHNYDKILCEKDCQDYLHDLRYARADGSNGGDSGDLRNTVRQLSYMVTVTLTLVCLMLIVLAGVLGFQLYRWKIKKNITLLTIKNKFLGKKAPESSTPAKTQTTQDADNKKDLRLEMPSTISNSDHSPVTVTTSISRRPAEDSTLDYAYDNPAMSASPR